MLPDPFHLLPAERLSLRSSRAGEILFREGEPTAGMFVSLGAEVRLERFGPAGEPVTIHAVRPGRSFAEASVFADRYHCDATVVAPGEIARVPSSVILAGFANPEFSTAYNRIMACQVQHYRQLLEIISIKSAVERVHAAIVAGLLEGSVITLSRRIALSHEATYRALRALVRAGRLENPGRGQYRLPSRQDHRCGGFLPDCIS